MREYKAGFSLYGTGRRQTRFCTRKQCLLLRLQFARPHNKEHPYHGQQETQGYCLVQLRQPVK